MANVNMKPIFTSANIYYLGKTKEGILKTNSTESNQGRLIVRIQSPQQPSLPSSVNGWTDYFVFEDFIDIANSTDGSLASLQRPEDTMFSSIIRKNLRHAWESKSNDANVVKNMYGNAPNDIANYITVMGIVVPSKKSPSEIDFNTSTEVIQQKGLVSDFAKDGYCDSFRTRANRFADANKIGYEEMAKLISKLDRPDVLSDLEHTDAYDQTHRHYLYLVVYKKEKDNEISLDYMYVIMKSEWGEIGHSLQKIGRGYHISVLRLGVIVPNDIGAPYKKDGFDIIVQNLYINPEAKWTTYTNMDTRHDSLDIIKGMFFNVPANDDSLKYLVCQ